MPLTNLNIGAAPNDGTGETLRSGGAKINTNYTFTVTTDTTQTITGAKTFTNQFLTVNNVNNTGEGATLRVQNDGGGNVSGAKSIIHLGRVGTADRSAKIGVVGVGINMTSPALFFETIGTERMRIAADGTVQLPSGSPGIKFGTRNANFADYEEGTWTPAYEANSGTFTTLTYSRQIGRYTKVGNVVHAWFRIATSNVSVGTASGTLRITGLPFPASTGGFVVEAEPFSSYGVAISHGNGWIATANTNNVSGFINNVDKLVFLVNQPFSLAAVHTFLSVSDMATGSAVRNYLGGTFTYRV
jgi:hypothetical protein